MHGAQFKSSRLRHAGIIPQWRICHLTLGANRKAATDQVEIMLRWRVVDEFCNTIGTFETSTDLRDMAAFGGKAVIS